MQHFHILEWCCRMMQRHRFNVIISQSVMIRTVPCKCQKWNVNTSLFSTATAWPMEYILHCLFHFNPSFRTLQTVCCLFVIQSLHSFHKSPYSLTFCISIYRATCRDVIWAWASNSLAPIPFATLVLWSTSHLYHCESFPAGVPWHPHTHTHR